MEDSYVLQLQDRKFKDFYLSSCGYAKCEPLHSFGPAVRPDYIMHYILEGRGKYKVGDVQYDLEAGQGFLIEPEVLTFYQADAKEPWTYLWIGFDGEKADEFMKDIGLNSQQLTFRSQRSAELKSIVINMLKNNTYSTSSQFMLESLLYSFLSVLTQDIEVTFSSEKERENLYIRKAIEYIQNTYSNNIRVTDIASYVCISRSYLYTLFQKNTGMSPQEYLANYRLTRAAQLLSLTEFSVSSVGMSCGYGDPLVFSKAFKSKMGMSPTQYRKECRNKQREHQRKNKKHLENL
ncbi:MAG: AraC family transcriptional regulator [Dorea sp.]